MTGLLHLWFRAVTLDELSDAQLLSPPGRNELGAHAANSEGSKNGCSAYYYVSVVRDVGQVTVRSPIAWKRRVNQQEIHQLSINCHFHTVVSCWVSSLYPWTQPDVKKLLSANAKQIAYSHIWQGESLCANCTWYKEIQYIEWRLRTMFGTF